MYNYSNNPIEHGFVMNRFSAMIDNGLLYRFNKHFNLLLLASIGYHVDAFIANNPNKYGGYGYNSWSTILPINTFKIGLSMGYRF